MNEKKRDMLAKMMKQKISDHIFKTLSQESQPMQLKPPGNTGQDKKVI